MDKGRSTAHTNSHWGHKQCKLTRLRGILGGKKKQTRNNQKKNLTVTVWHMLKKKIITTWNTLKLGKSLDILKLFPLNKIPNKLFLVAQAFSTADNVLLWALCICCKKTSLFLLGFSSALPGVVCCVIHEELSPSRVVRCGRLERSWVQEHGWLIQSSFCWHNCSRSRKGVGRGWKA